MLPLRIEIFARIALPEQRLELLGELVNSALPFLTTPPPLQHAIAQQPEAQAEYHPTDEEGYGHVLRRPHLSTFTIPRHLDHGCLRAWLHGGGRADGACYGWRHAEQYSAT